MSRKVCGPKPSPEQTGGMILRPAYGCKASNASLEKRGEAVCDSNTHNTVQNLHKTQNEYFT